MELLNFDQRATARKLENSGRGLAERELRAFIQI
jgi:hypothetical protein